ncbi:MAG: hypothetical protein IKT89_02870 [Clostridia bacterium]|nr:hypothetical protein [Clostridia bacterium]
MSGEKNKLDSKSKQLIVGIFAFLILLTFSAVMIIAVQNFGLASGNLESTNADMSNTPHTVVGGGVSTPDVSLNTPSTTVIDNVIDTNVIAGETNKKEEISVEGLEPFTKTGDNQISDSPNNGFIKLIVNEKGVSAEKLVAIYAVPDLGNNFVLEFDNKRDENGNIIRSPKTLKRIYHINKERKITVATGKPTGNEGVDYGTSLMTYYLVTDVVMPEFPDYFTDVG